jgi:two-component system, cell cycle sensor histidine kinase and response regulator CckA
MPASPARPALDVLGQPWTDERPRLLEGLVAHAHDAILLTEAEPAAETGPRIRSANPAFTALTGYMAEEVHGRPLGLLRSPRTDPHAFAQIRAAVHARQPLRLELVIARKDGSDRWVELVLMPVAEGAHGLLYWAVFLRDVSARKRTEASLQESEARWHSLVDSIPEDVYILDRDGTIRYVNRFVAFPRAEQVLGHSGFEFILPEYHDRARELLARAWEGERPVEFEAQAHTPARGVLWISGRLSAIRQDGRPVALIACVRDVSEPKRVEQALREGEERYRTLVEMCPEAIFLVQDERLAYVNPAAVPLLGAASAAELVGRAVADCLHPDDRARGEARLRYVAETGQVSIPCGLRLAGPDGRAVEVEARGGPCLFGGRPAVQVVGHNATARVPADEALRLSHECFQLVARATGDGIWDWNTVTGEVWWNAAFYRCLGLDPATTRPGYDAWSATVHPEERERVLAGFQAAVRRGDETWSDEYRIVRPDGSTRHVFDRAYVLRDAAGKAVRMIGAVTDVTDRKQAEAERAALDRQLQETQKLESLGVLAGGIAHDFNNLLTVILGYAQLAGADLAPSSAPAAHLLRIEQAARRAADLCQQMLAYAGKGRFVVGPLDLSACVRDTAPLLQASVSKKARLVFRLAGGLPPVLGDAAQIRQVVISLVVNAGEALGDGEGRIEVTTGVERVGRDVLAGMQLGADRPGGEYVVLEVRDDGCGMDAATQARIFEPFFTTKFTGRGLGLSAVLGIVRGHHGAIRVESVPGRGSTFRLLFPRAPGATTPPPAADPAAAPRQEGTILVVDDEDGVRTLAALLLQQLGFEVVQAADGPQGLEQFRRHTAAVRLVLLDLTMPHWNGEETLRELRKESADVPVILMSGYSERELRQRFAGQGVAGFLQKPFTRQDLIDRVNAALAGVAPTPP